MQVRILPFRLMAGVLMSIKVEPKAKDPAGHRRIKKREKNEYEKDNREHL